MAQARAWLIDVYETVLAVDFSAVTSSLARIAGVPEAAFAAAARRVAEPTKLGRLSWPVALEQVLRDCGLRPAAPLVSELVAADRRLLIQHARVFDDAHRLLRRLRSADIPSALVSNCSEHTRHLLEQLGLDRLVDDVVLSCEVGAAKPDPEIYRSRWAGSASHPRPPCSSTTRPPTAGAPSRSECTQSRSCASTNTCLERSHRSRVGRSAATSPTSTLADHRDEPAPPGDGHPVARRHVSRRRRMQWYEQTTGVLWPRKVTRMQVQRCSSGAV